MSQILYHWKAVFLKTGMCTIDYRHRPLCYTNTVQLSEWIKTVNKATPHLKEKFDISGKYIYFISRRELDEKTDTSHITASSKRNPA